MVMALSIEAVCSLIDYYDWDVLAIQEARPSQFADLAKLVSASVTAERDGDGLGEGIRLYYQRGFRVIRFRFVLVVIDTD